VIWCQHDKCEEELLGFILQSTSDNQHFLSKGKKKHIIYEEMSQPFSIGNQRVYKHAISLYLYLYPKKS
jgi:hypothetical protein